MGKKFSLLLALVAINMATASAYPATLFRTYLSVDGNDSNPCTVSAPCRLLPAALASTQIGGEVWMLDSANYNTTTVSITQSASILAVPGALGSLVANGGDAVDINGTATITFRNLVFREIDNQYAFDGISVNSSNAEVVVNDSEFSNFNFGVNLLAIENININSSRFYSSVAGIRSYGASAAGTTNATSTIAVTACDFRENNNGVSLVNSSVTLSRSVLSSNLSGVAVNGGDYVVLDNNLIDNNSVGVEFSGSTQNYVYSTGTNSIVGNLYGLDGGSLTHLSQQ